MGAACEGLRGFVGGMGFGGAQRELLGLLLGFWGQRGQDCQWVWGETRGYWAKWGLVGGISGGVGVYRGV